VAAYDAATGVAKWCRPDDPSAIPEPWPTIAASSDTTVVLHTPAGELTALDLATGAPRWTTSLPLGLNPRLDIVDGTVVVLDATRTATFAGQPQDTTDTVLGVFDLASGRPLDHPDEVETNNGLETGLTSAPDGLELIAEGGPEPYRFTVSVKDHTTGEQLWVQTRHAVGAFLDRDIVFVVDQPGPLSPAESHDIDTTLIALRATDGSELWRTSIHAAAPNPTVAGDLVLWTVDSQIQAFDRTTGAPRWTVDHGSPGRGGDATEPGQYQGFGVSDDGTVTAGFIYAEPPYRD
jgi:outer membrane protein assembly factor BamB